MRVCIHRGSKQIGGSCIEVETDSQRLLIDLGLPLDAEKNSIQYLPKISGLDGSDPSLLGILISHPHLDHFGLLTHISALAASWLLPHLSYLATGLFPHRDGITNLGKVLKWALFESPPFLSITRHMMPMHS
jgi:mRNA degradation ribonuclease J1/J2